ncbi:ABC transporter permease [Alcaligenaceae bacterium]|nr:ABC transporter permease [Alcaligenaceae bacterium]
MPKFVLLWTDAFILLALLAVILQIWRARRSPAMAVGWQQVFRRPSAVAAGVVLACFALIGVLDSIHYRPLLPPAPGAADQPAVHSPITRSALDAVLDLTQLPNRERTYSAPLALRQFTKESWLVDGEVVRDYPRLQYAGLRLADESQRGADLLRRALTGMALGAAAAVGLALLLTGLHARRRGGWSAGRRWWWRESDVPWRAFWITASVICLLGAVTLSLAADYHVLGTDRTGNDVLWLSLKSVRTALVIGLLTTFAMLPPAIFFGITAGYFKGRVDDVVQYVYTTLTSIPGVLLVAACVLMMQVYIDNNPELFDTVAARADLRLFLLCLILGLTGWAGLCRLLRAETLKLRELEYVQAARAFGVSHWRIMRRHLLPNVMHIVLITMVLQFSGLVLYEAVLSYLGIGVDPSTPSYGTMIDAARTEMSRDPMIWWNLLAAFVFLLALVLSANIFADAVQDAFDPRMRRIQPRRLMKTGRRPLGAAAPTDPVMATAVASTERKGSE